MDERISNEDLPPRVRTLRRCQVILAVCGMGFFLLALVGGALQSRLVAFGGLIGFGAALVSLLAVGVATWAISPKPKPD